MNSKTSRHHRLRHRLPAFFARAGLAVTLGLALIEPAAAQSTGLEPLEKAVNFLVEFLTGPFGRAIAILACIVLGFLALMGRITYIMAGLACLGIGLIFGAPQIVDSLVSAVGS